ncbi:acetyl-CoA synthetase-like protein [Hypoxylon argillaceum]|nr:acetyl-CoA synthetase-like protein [Hypoxylon argillaceum]
MAAHEHKVIVYSLGNLSNPREVPYRALYTQAIRYSHVIQSLKGFTQGDPVVLHLDDHYDGILWFWAVVLANGCPVMSSPFSNIQEFRERHIRWLGTLLESPIWITRDSSLYLFSGGSPNMRIHAVEALEERALGIETNSPGYLSLEHRLSDNAFSKRTEEPALMMLTSGSTGNAKIVPISYRQIMAAIRGKAAVRELPPGRPFLNWVALDHVASLIEIHLQALWLGVDQIHVHPADVVSNPTTLLDLFSFHRVCRSFAPNFLLAKLLCCAPDDQCSKWDLSDLTLLASGGESNDIQTCIAASAFLGRYGAPPNVIVPGFGMTETCAGAIFNLDCPEYDTRTGRDVASVGKCMQGIRMRIVARGDAGRRVAEPNELGDLELCGDVVFCGYYRNAEATVEAVNLEGWFCTGDQGFIDDSGNLHLSGRAKDVININGVKIISADVQHALEQALGSRVSRVVCFPSKASHTEQITVAYWPSAWPMELHDMAEINELILQACALSASSRPFIFALRECSIPLLPLSSLGKISPAKMRRMFEAGMFAKDVNEYHLAMAQFQCKVRQDSVMEAVITDTEMNLLEDFASVLGVDKETLSVGSTVFELGFTSMRLVQLKHRVDSRLGISIPMIEFLRNPNIRSLASALELMSTPEKADMASESVSSDYDPVVTFRSGGSKVPLWLVHPGVGEVLVFVGLAQHLAGDDRPIYALRARGFEAGETPFTSITEAVETYVAAIRRRQPQGPYAIAGYSYGTMLAFEMAKKLDAESGGTSVVRFLGSFNLPPHIKHRMRQLSWNMCLLHLAQFLDLVTETHVETLEDSGYRLLPPNVALARVLHDADESRRLELGLSEGALKRWADVAYGLQSMATDYEPEGLVDSIDVFHAIPLKVAAASREEWLLEHLSKWQGFSRTTPRYHSVGGEHYTMIGPHHVQRFSAVLIPAMALRGI